MNDLIQYIPWKLGEKKLTLNKTLKKTSSTKKNYLIVVFVGIILFAFMIPYSLYVSAQQGHVIENLDQIKSNYIIQHLQGDTIDTWLSWRLSHDDILHVDILDDDKYPNKVELIKNVILSTEVFEITNSMAGKENSDSTTFYLGWIGALEKASQTKTTFYIPKNIEVIDSKIGAGDITIQLVDYSDGDGYSGFTKSIADEDQNQILKSEIIIYNVDELNDDQISSIIRHEFGHALGLAHSTDPQDLMAPKLDTEYPYISECDVDAIISLYDEGKSSRVVCKK